VLRYGFRTINGSTGGVRLEQLEMVTSRKEAAATADLSNMVEKEERYLDS
jgi:hypothetical protein